MTSMSFNMQLQLRLISETWSNHFAGWKHNWNGPRQLGNRPGWGCVVWVYAAGGDHPLECYCDHFTDAVPQAGSDHRT